MNQFRDLLVILLFSLVFRAVLSLAFWSLSFEVEYAYYFRLANALFFYAMLLLISIRQLGINGEDLSRVVGPSIEVKQIYSAIAAGLLYFILENGEQAIEVLLISNIDLDFAYQWWNFSEVPVNPPRPFSFRVLAYILISVLIGPAVEEFFFRGLLLRSYAEKHGFHKAAIVTSLLFVMLHYAQPAYVMCFVFSLTLSYIYACTRSLAICWAFHATFNMLAYVQQQYLDFMWTRSIGGLNSLSQWAGQIALFIVTAALVTVWLVKHRQQLFAANLA